MSEPKSFPTFGLISYFFIIFAAKIFFFVW